MRKDANRWLFEYYQSPFDLYIKFFSSSCNLKLAETFPIELGKKSYNI